MCFSHVEGMEKVIGYYPFLPQRQLGGRSSGVPPCLCLRQLSNTWVTGPFLFSGSFVHSINFKSKNWCLIFTVVNLLRGLMMAHEGHIVSHCCAHRDTGLRLHSSDPSRVVLPTAVLPKDRRGQVFTFSFNKCFY